MKNWRANVFLFLIFVLAAVVISRLFYFQVLNRKFYQAQALGQQVGFKEIKGSRGEVFLINSKQSRGQYISSDELKSLVINKDRWLIAIVPDKITDKNNFAKVLSEKLKEVFGSHPEFTSQSLLTKIEKSDSYTIIKKDLSTKEIEPFKNLKLDGLSIENNLGRYYPQKQMAAHIVGFLGGDGTGQYGIEGYYNDILNGKEGIKEERRGLDTISQEDFSYLNGSDLYLTIDYNIQFEAESLLKEAKNNIDIDSGQIIVLKPDSGRVLALANFPSFDPNQYSKENNLEIFQNSAIQKIFEPGSVFKPFTVAMALNDNKITPQTAFVDTGSVTIGPNTIYNFDRRVYKEQDISGILEKSINTGAVFVSQQISNQTFIDYLDKFAFNVKSEIDLQGEVSSQNEILKKGSAFGFATASFGQGIEMTPIQLARSFATFANGGKIIKPYIIDKIVHGQDNVDIKPQISQSVISEQTALDVTKMLINVVNQGFGKGAKIDGYYLAGKTGTAQVPFKDKKGYYPDRTIQSFIGFGPALKPEFLILVKLDNPKVPQSSLSAAPIFKKLSQYIINYWQIPPDY